MGGTPNARGFRGGGMFNHLFIDPLIKLLEKRAAAQILFPHRLTFDHF